MLPVRLLPSSIFSEIKNSPFADDIIIVGFVDVEDKPAIYNLSSLFVYPSFFEGFGFPPLEAMKCGLPVITSNSSSLPEVAGDAALLVDPENPHDIARGMATLARDETLQASLREKGKDRITHFSWEKAALELHTLIRTSHGNAN